MTYEQSLRLRGWAFPGVHPRFRNVLPRFYVPRDFMEALVEVEWERFVRLP